MEYTVKSPICYIVFNRLDTVKITFEEIKKVKPAKLYIVSDGARESKEGEKEKVENVRKYIETNVDWECDVYTNYSPRNLGCKSRVSSGISWCFENEEQLIILEDDILVNESFFRFCDSMLEYYKEDNRVMHIGGYNPIDENPNCPFDYFFTRASMIWGWATWKRAWSLFDPEMSSWPEVRDNNMLFNPALQKETYEDEVIKYDKVYNHEMDSWGYAWGYTIDYNGGLCILPQKNLIENVGFGEDATHTSSNSNKTVGCRHDLGSQINYRKDHIIDYWFDQNAGKWTLGHVLKWRLRKYIPPVILRIRRNIINIFCK